MQLKYQFEIMTRFRISIKRLLVVLPVYCGQYLETKLNKETYMKVTISTFTLYPQLLNAWAISMQYLTILFSRFSEDF